ncbi:Nif3-like dinuclear metal center hexameric protein [Agaribacter flavus]|uniref:Nif3-like dinuclear metal center hexameric protein n=1 Tax=Agaribacter flavus TaxID=1902781 RepID=A0ABV7FJ05_9ALTE
MRRQELNKVLDELLSASSIKDYCPNGLQVEGSQEIKRIVSGVTASQALIDSAIEREADTILVHHGYFWKNEAQVLVGMKHKRIKSLFQNDINLFAYHLPIDVHPTLGNNAQIGKRLGLENIVALPDITPQGIVMSGRLPQPISHQQLTSILSSVFARQVVSVGDKQNISQLAWCSGGGQNYIDAVVDIQVEGKPIDAFISGEISEQTTHSAREQGIDYFAVGHHASERYGVKAVGEWLAQHFDVEVQFVDIDNPA